MNDYPKQRHVLDVVAGIAKAAGGPADEFQEIALAMPDAAEGSHRGHSDFRVGNRIFATLGYPDTGWAMVKLTPEQQEIAATARDDGGAHLRSPYTRW